MKRITSIPNFLFATALGLFVAACGGGSSGGGGSGGPATGMGAMTIQVTDDPFVFEIVDEAKVWVDRVTIHVEEDDQAGDDDDDSGSGGLPPVDHGEGWRVLYQGSPVELDLLSLSNGVVRTIAQGDLEPGTYRQIRMRVTSGRLLLENGNLYTTDADTLQLHGQGVGGFKVMIEPPFTVAEGVGSTLLLDFDLTHSFHPIPASDPLNANRYSLHPVIHVSNHTTSGEIRGQVTAVDGTGTHGVADATVYVLPHGAASTDDAIAATGTNPDGLYVQLGLAPGDYDLIAVKDALDGRVDGIHVTAGNFTTANIVID